MESFIKKTPSAISIQALEKTEILIIDKQELERLFFSIPKLERLFRIITENMLIASYLEIAPEYLSESRKK